jgi:hypothetical protein
MSAATPVFAQIYVVGLGGTAALSGDSGAAQEPVSSSNYDAKVGPAVNIGAGRHLNDWFSLQINYMWNQNRIVFTETRQDAYSQRVVTESQHAANVDLLLYFRSRASWVRPYLAAGPSFVRQLGETNFGLRVPVGADIRLGSDWWFRYSFSEMISTNPYGKSLQPPGSHRLMNFQNLFGVVWSL